MIFVTTGSRKFQFDRLIRELDRLAESGEVTEPIFAQIAETKYLPHSIGYKRYLSPEEFSEYQDKADLIITHAGTGALIGALKKGKQVIAVPRFKRFGEHSDDHQLQVAQALKEEGYLRVVLNIKNLGKAIKLAYDKPIIKKYDKPSRVVPMIEEQIDKWFR